MLFFVSIGVLANTSGGINLIRSQSFQTPSGSGSPRPTSGNPTPTPTSGHDSRRSQNWPDEHNSQASNTYPSWHGGFTSRDWPGGHHFSFSKGWGPVSHRPAASSAYSHDTTVPTWNHTRSASSYIPYHWPPNHAYGFSLTWDPISHFGMTTNHGSIRSGQWPPNHLLFRSSQWDDGPFGHSTDRSNDIHYPITSRVTGG
jgi:hypothetical protein